MGIRIHTFGIIIVGLIIALQVNLHAQIHFERIFQGSGLVMSECYEASGGDYWITGTIDAGTPAADFYLMRLDSLGYPKWTKRYNIPNNDSLHFGIPLPNGDFWMVGKHQSSTEIDMCMIRVDSAGNILTANLLDLGDDDLAFSGVLSTNGSVMYIGGRVKDVGAGGTDGFVMKLLSNGTILWTRTLGGPLNDAIVSVSLKGTGVTATGYARGFITPGDTMPDILFAGFSATGNLTTIPSTGPLAYVMGEPFVPEYAADIQYIGGAGFWIAGTSGFAINSKGFAINVSNAGIIGAIQHYQIPLGSPLSGQFIGLRRMVRNTQTGNFNLIGSVGNLGSGVKPFICSTTLNLNTVPGASHLFPILSAGPLLAGVDIKHLQDNSTAILATDFLDTGSVFAKMDALGTPLCNQANLELTKTSNSILQTGISPSNTANPISIAVAPIALSISVNQNTQCASCHIQPDFTGLPDTLCTGMYMPLTNTTIGGYVFEWRDNGVTFSANQNPVWSSTTGGIHQIEMRAYTQDSFCVGVKLDTVFVESDSVSAAFSVSSITQNSKVKFTDLSFNATQIHWDFGDGHSSTARNPIHFYENIPGTGVITVRQIAMNGCLADTSEMIITIGCTPPQANFRGGCCKNIGEFKDFTQSNCPYTLHWDFGDDSTSTDANPTHIYQISPNTVNNYTVTLTVTNGIDTSIYTQSVTTGGFYTSTDWPPARTPIVPYFWESPLFNFPGDISPQDRIEDEIIASGASVVNIIVALKRCDHIDSLLEAVGTIRYKGKYAALVCVDSVNVSDLPIILADSSVLMIFHDNPKQVIPQLPASPISNFNQAISGNHYSFRDYFPDATGLGVTVGILGGGINDGVYPGLGKDKCAIWYDAVNNNYANPSATNKFSSQIAEVVLGGYDPFDTISGVAPRAILADFKVANDFGFARRSDIIRAIEEAIDSSQVDILLCPFDFPGVTNGHDPLSEVANIAVLNGLIFIATGGENGIGGINAPGAASEVITTANFNDSLNREPNSSIGQPSLNNAGNPKPDFASLGVNIAVTQGIHPEVTFDKKTHSAFATAYLTGLISVFLGINPQLSPLHIKQLLRNTAQNIGTPGWDAYSGHGFINPDSTIANLYAATNHQIFFPPSSNLEYDSPFIDVSMVDETLAVGSLQKVVVTYRVTGSNTLKGTVIRLYGARMGTSNEYWVLADKQIPVLTPGLHTDTILFYPQVETIGICISAKLINPTELDMTDNSARSNKHIQEKDYQDTTVVSFYVSNSSCSCATMELKLRDSLPECFEMELTRDSVQLCDSVCPVKVTLKMWLNKKCCKEKGEEILRPYQSESKTGGDCDCGCCMEKICLNIDRVINSVQYCCYEFDENGLSSCTSINPGTIPQLNISSSITQPAPNSVIGSVMDLGTSPYVLFYWVIDGVDTLLGANMSYTFSTSGQHIVCRYAISLCDTYVHCDTILGMVGLPTNTLFANSITVSPNPFSDDLIIQTRNLPPGKMEIIMRNMNGVIVKQSEIWIQGGLVEEFPLSTFQIPAGTYFLELIQGKQRTTRQIIKQ